MPSNTKNIIFKQKQKIKQLEEELKLARSEIEDQTLAINNLTEIIKVQSQIVQKIETCIDTISTIEAKQKENF